MKNIKKILFGLFSLVLIGLVACEKVDPPVTTATSQPTTSVSTSSNVDTTKPTFSGLEDKTIELGVSFNPYLGISASDDVDGDLTSSIDIILPNGVNIVNGKITFTEVGVYTLTYVVEDNAKNKATQQRKITVINEEIIDVTAPIISGYQNHTVKVNESVDILNGVIAIDDIDGDISNKITAVYPTEAIVTNNLVKFTQSGTYEITLSVIDIANNKASVKLTVIVEDLDLVAPVITMENIQATTYHWVDLTKGLSVIDNYDGDITNKTKISLPSGIISYDNKIQFTTEGHYSIKYSAKDNSNNASEKTITVNVTSADNIPSNLIENGTMDLGRHILVSNSGSGYITKTTASTTIDINSIVDNKDSIYLERRSISFTKDLTVTSFYITSVGTDELENPENYRVDVGYYNDNNEFILISSNNSLTNLEKFTPNITTTKGVLRIIFKKTGTFTLKEIFLQSGTTGTNPNQVRDTEKGNAFYLPYGWITESTANAITATTQFDSLKNQVIKYDVSSSATNANLQYENFELTIGKTYVFSFDMKANKDIAIKAIIGHHTQSTSVSSTLKATNEFNIALTSSWNSYEFEFTPSETSPLYKIRFVTVKDTTYYLTNVRVHEKEIAIDDQKAEEFTQAVLSIGEVTLDSEALINNVFTLYNNLSAADKAKVVTHYDLLVEKNLYLTGLKNISFTQNTFYFDSNIDLNIYTASPQLGESLTVSFTCDNPNYLNGNILTVPNPSDITVYYTFKINDEVVALYQRIIHIIAPTPASSQQIIQNHDFSKPKYEVYSIQENAISLVKDIDALNLIISDVSKDVYLERLGVSLRKNSASTTIAITATFTDINYEDLVIVIGYYLEDGSFFIDYQSTLLSDGKTKDVYIPNVTTNEGILRIYFKKTGSVKITKVLYQTGTSGVQNVIRDQAAGAFQGPAFFASGSSGVTSITMKYEDNALVANVTSSSNKPIFYENFTLEKGKTYVVSLTVKGKVGTKLTLDFASYYQNTTTSAFSSSSATNKMNQVIDLTDEYQTLTFTYTITDTPNSSNGFKTNFTFAANAITYIKDFTITEQVS